jgi:hypothetical protein
MRAHVDLKLQPAERAALRALDDEERQAVVDDLLDQVREDLEWMVARAAVPDELQSRPPVVLRPLGAVRIKNAR